MDLAEKITFAFMCNGFGKKSMESLINLKPPKKKLTVLKISYSGSICCGHKTTKIFEQANVKLKIRMIHANLFAFRPKMP